MEPETPSLTIEKVDKFENLKKITPFSKYLALVLFILLPFIGGLIGYVYAPEKEVMIEKIIEVEKEGSYSELASIENGTAPLSMNELDTTKDIVTRVTIDTLPLESGVQGDYSPIKKYSFQNGIYSVSFDLSTSAIFSDDYSDPSKDDLGKGTYQGDFVKRTYNEDAIPLTITEERYFEINVFSKNYCLLSLCEYDTKSKVSLNGNEWEYIGSTRYCDVGYCGGYSHVYRRSLGTYMVYLKATEDLTGENLNENVRRVIDSLSINLIN